jgi:hypothetical protein
LVVAEYLIEPTGPAAEAHHARENIGGGMAGSPLDAELNSDHLDEANLNP